MLSRLTSPVANLLGGAESPAKSTKGVQAGVDVKSIKGVPELLAELAEVRAKKAELEKREADIVAAAKARLLQERQALEGLKKKVTECGIEVNEDWMSAPVVASNA